MPLISQILEADLLKILKNTNNTPEKTAKELSVAITKYIKQATITTNGMGTGANGGGPIVTKVTGTGKII